MYDKQRQEMYETLTVISACSNMILNRAPDESARNVFRCLSFLIGLENQIQAQIDASLNAQEAANEQANAQS